MLCLDEIVSPVEPESASLDSMYMPCSGSPLVASLEVQPEEISAAAKDLKKASRKNFFSQGKVFYANLSKEERQQEMKSRWKQLYELAHRPQSLT